MAYTAEEAFLEAMGFASRGYGHEPEMPESVAQCKATHVSRVEKLFKKIERLYHFIRQKYDNSL